MTITVINDLLCSAILTLIVLPVLYQLFDNKKFTLATQPSQLEIEVNDSAEDPNA